MTEPAMNPVATSEASHPTGQGGEVAVVSALPAEPTKGKTPINMGARGLVLATIDDLWRFANFLAQSDLAPKDYKGKPYNCFIALELTLELGLLPLQGIQNIAVISGKPSIYGPLGLALVDASGLLEDKEGLYEGTAYEDTYKYRFMTQRRGRKPYWTEFSVAQAKRAKLWAKAGPWTDYPDAMLMWRAIWPNLNYNFADVLKGLGAAEIQQDIIDITPGAAAGATDPAQTAALTERINAAREKLDGVKATPATQKPEQTVVADAPPPVETGEIATPEQIGRLNALVDSIDQLQDGAGMSALSKAVGTIDLDAITIQQATAAEAHLAGVFDKLTKKLKRASVGKDGEQMSLE